MILNLLLALNWTQAVHADIAKYLQPRPHCAETLAPRDAIEAELNKIFDRLKIMRARPSPPDPNRLSEILKAVAESGKTVGQLSPQSKNLTRLKERIDSIYVGLNELLTSNPPPADLPSRIRSLGNNLNGILFEALVANRFSGLAPRIGEEVEQIYPGRALPRNQSAKELDLVLPAAESTKDVWIEVKYLSSRGPSHEMFQTVDPSIRKKIIKQIKNMISARDKIDPGIKIYVVVSTDLHARIQKQISDLGVELLHFPVMQ